MAKLTTSPIASFSQSAITTINQNMDLIETAVENTLSRDGTTPNQMGADIDLNGNDLLNVNTLDADVIILDGEVLIPADINSGTAAEILTAIKTVDGTGSGLDADLLRGTTPSSTGLSILSASSISDVANLLDDVQYVADRTALKAIDTTKITTVFLQEGKREGHFKWTTGNFSTQITADTSEGVYIKANAIASTAGSWVRVFAGPLNVFWFGAAGDNSQDDQPSFVAAYAMAKVIGSATTEGPCHAIWGPPGYRYKFGGSLSLDTPVKLTVEGEIFYTPTTGAAIIVGSSLHGARGNTQYDIQLGVLRAVNGNSSAPT